MSGIFNGRNAFGIVLLLIVLGVFGYWYFTQPSLQEKALTSFFDNVRKGNPEEAAEFLVNSSFGQFLKDSKITDTDGNDLKEGIENDVAYLEDLAMSYVPAAKGHVFIFEAESLETQKSKSDPNVATVNFKYRFTVKEVFDEPSHPGRVEGKMELVRSNNKWLVKSGDFRISIQGITLRRYWQY